MLIHQILYLGKNMFVPPNGITKIFGIITLLNSSPFNRHIVESLMIIFFILSTFNTYSNLFTFYKVTILWRLAHFKIFEETVNYKRIVVPGALTNSVICIKAPRRLPLIIFPGSVSVLMGSLGI